MQEDLIRPSPTGSADALSRPPSYDGARRANSPQPQADDEALSLLLAYTTRDLNNLLQAQVVYIDHLCSMIKDESYLDVLHRIRHSVSRISGLAELFSEVRTTQEPNQKQILIQDVIHTFEPLLRSILPPHIRLAVFAEKNLLPINSTSWQIAQLLTNLVIGARDSIPENGGSITIIAQNVSLNDNEIQTSTPDSEHVLLSVKDTGAGDTREFANVHEMLKPTNGHLVVDAHPDFGTTARLYFPVSSTLKPVG